MRLAPYFIPMTDEEILTKALEKAIENGYKFTSRLKHVPRWDSDDYFPVIFSHDFAKAFWGEEMTFVKAYEGTDFNGLYLYSEGGEPAVIEAWQWQWHLSQMVLEKEPLQYLKKFL